jgi:hypothetical protein
MRSQIHTADGSDTPDVLGFFTRVAKNILAGTRVASFRSFSGSEFSTGAWHILALVAVDVCISIGYDYVSVEPERYFSSYGFQHSGTLYLLLVFGLFVLASIQGDKGGTPRLLVIVLSTLPVISLVSLSANYFYYRSEHYTLTGGWLIWLAWLAWSFAIVYRVIRDRYSMRRRRAVSLILLYAAVTVTPQFVFQNVPFWYSYNPDDYAETEERVSVNTEEVYYAQPALLERWAGDLSAHRPGLTDLYFVGFGSYAAQDVFMKEVAYVRRLFDESFDTSGRSISLVNNVQTVSRVPLANASNLRLMLKNVASRMDSDEDVLFLFLTSHGSEDAVLSVNFWPIDPNDLTDDDLHAILAESGIKWRILVISACYSGSFIERLKDDHTLIITAAHANNTSFGCSNDRDLTYFGEHYFSRELAKGGSFVDAFYRAKETLRERELAENVAPSDPQIFIGAEMERKLEDLDRRFRTGPQRMADASSGHCHQDPARTLEGFPAVHGEDVVENQQIACAPGESDLRTPTR